MSGSAGSMWATLIMFIFILFIFGGLIVVSVLHVRSELRLKKSLKEYLDAKTKEEKEKI